MFVDKYQISIFHTTLFGICSFLLPMLGRRRGNVPTPFDVSGQPCESRSSTNPRALAADISDDVDVFVCALPAAKLAAALAYAKQVRFS